MEYLNKYIFKIFDPQFTHPSNILSESNQEPDKLYAN